MQLVLSIDCPFLFLVKFVVFRNDFDEHFSEVQATNNHYAFQHNAVRLYFDMFVFL